MPDEPPDVDPPDGDHAMSGPVGRAASTVRDLVGNGPKSPSDPQSRDGPDDPPTPSAAWPDEREDAAQAAARGTTTSPDSPSENDIIIAEDSEAAHEDDAQVSARTEFASSSDLSPGEEAPAAAEEDPSVMDMDPVDGADPSPSGGRVVSEPTGETPDLAELREQLNDQFESIKIVEPGEYELNLMELYEREEYIIALQENGRYVIQMPERWMDDGEGE